MAHHQDDDGLNLTITETATTEPSSGPEPITPLGTDRFSVTHDGQPFEVSAVSVEGRRFLFFGRLIERSDSGSSSGPTATTSQGPRR